MSPVPKRHPIKGIVLVLAVSLGACSNGLFTTESPDPVIEAVWASDYEGRRLLSDSAWIWCTDNRESVSDVGSRLGLGVISSPYELFRSCKAAAGARGGGIDEVQPGDQLVGVARVAGYSNEEAEIIKVGLQVCRRFDTKGVTSESIDDAIYQLIFGPSAQRPPGSLILDNLLLLPPQAGKSSGLGLLQGDNKYSAEMVVGAASAGICPEYAEEVASYG